MRALVLVLALSLACAAALAATESPGSNNSESTMSESDTAPSNGTTTGTCVVKPGPMASGDEMADACIANSLGLTRQQVRDLRSQGLTYADIATAQAIAKKACKSIDDVMAVWKPCKSWPDTAKKFNLSMSDLMRWPMMGSSDTETFNAMFIAQYYNIPQAQIAQLRTDGFAWDEINVIANASVRTGQSLQQIASLRSQGMSWSDIASKYNVSLADLTCPVPAKRVVTQAATGAGPSCPLIMYTGTGNILLTEDAANRLYDEGNDWIDVAIAANMSRVTTLPIRWFLQQVRTGILWRSLITEFNVNPKIAFNVADYPFARRSVYNQGTEANRLAMIEKWQCPGAKDMPDYPIMTGRMPTASPFFNPSFP